MALLYYHNLGVERAEWLLGDVVHRLAPIHQFLSRTRDYLCSEEAILRLAWKESTAPKTSDHTQSGVWIELVEPEDRPNEPESTFRAFFDENNQQVFEVAYPAQLESGAAISSYAKKSRPTQTIRGRDAVTNRILVDRKPDLPCLQLRPNTYALDCQQKAIWNLQDSPRPEHLPLLRLLETSSRAHWLSFEVNDPDLGEWITKSLHDLSRPGTEAQRKFVSISLATPDFAFLEGPPGSGKTTAICELVLQLVRGGKRVLLCASTHVAVDNVLERLKKEDTQDLLPVRIGDESNISQSVREYRLSRIVETVKMSINQKLSSIHPRSDSQETLYGAIKRKDDESIQEMILNSANLICGTTIGILQHPDIKRSRDERRVIVPQFDYMILDEASKTTFQEFLVPALHAKKWIIVGDPRQLSPYVEEDSIAANICACLNDKDNSKLSEIKRNACVDVFLAQQGNLQHRRTTLVMTDNDEVKNIYERQAEGTELTIASAESATLSLADIVIESAGKIEEIRDRLPLDILTIRGDLPKKSVVVRRVKAWQNHSRRKEDLPLWEREVAWRMIEIYGQRMLPGSKSARNYETDLIKLLPYYEPEKVKADVNQVKRIAFPSILESLQGGLGRDQHQDRRSEGNALSDGLPPDRFVNRHVRLEYQHRMHPEISVFSRENIYDGEALKDPEGMAKDREPFYPGYGSRAVWINIDRGFDQKSNSNPTEATTIIDEIKRFAAWAKNNQKSGGKWEVAILTFYRGQERCIRDKLRNLPRQHDGYRYFVFENLKIELCTVDRFQGHEADIVYLSFANSKPTSFLESPNRLNVALTRARYQRVIVGDQTAMKGSSRKREDEFSILRRLAMHEIGPILFRGEQ